MSQVDFKEIAKYCVEEYKEAVTSEISKYISTLYVSIDSNNEVLCSWSPHVLSEAEKCILIHTKQELANINWYDWYSVDYINEKGCVLGTNLGNGSELRVVASGGYSNQIMELIRGNYIIYMCRPPFEHQMQKVWDIYRIAEKCETEQSIKLLTKIIDKDEIILDLKKKIKELEISNYILEKQKKQYEQLLDEIKELVENRK
jgi:hypothetical protein